MSDMTIFDGKVLQNLIIAGDVSLVIIVCVVCWAFHKTTGSLENVMKGPLLPIITVLAIVFSTVLLAMIGLIKENAVSAIFGSIAGYVLGSIVKKSEI